MVGTTVWLGARRTLLLPAAWRPGRPLPPAAMMLCTRFQLRNGATDTTAELINTAVLVEKAYAELQLKSIQHQVGGVRVRQHVNPLKASLIVPVTPPVWETLFADPTLPLHIDIGCGSGRFLMLLAKRTAAPCNFLGLDVRDKLLQRSRLWAEELNLTNLHFMVANATIGLDAILSTYPGKVSLVSILCPDPHFKKRHQKRRIVQKCLVDALAKHLAPGGQIFLQSDVREVAVDMRDQFDANTTVFTCVHTKNSADCDQEGWLLENPLGVATEREIHALAQGGRLYRLLYRRL
ncbi:hypothetical protein CY35_17G053600 [Sphagnum magellanicum]|nr:hypothetical protein CY35_17G053600 [Sphagnum magellanicum]